MKNTQNQKPNIGRAKIIREERKKRGWSQTQLSEIASLSDRTVQRAEKDGIVGLDTLQALASAFNTSVEYLSPKSEAKRDTDNSPKVLFLSRLKSGKDIVENMGKMEMYQNNYDELQNENEVDLIGGFFQNIVDWGDIWMDLEEVEKVRYTYGLNSQIAELEKFGFWLFGNRRNVTFSVQCAGGQKKNIPMEVSTYFIKRSNCSQILRTSIGEEKLPVIF